MVISSSIQNRVSQYVDAYVQILPYISIGPPDKACRRG